MNEEELEEKTFNEYVCILNKSKQLEKELKQTKLNFKNSQTHSKNCYKKLKEKYEKLERAYKNNKVMTRDLNELINRNLELKKDYDLLDKDYDQLFEKFFKSEIENQELKEAIKILKGNSPIIFLDYNKYGAKPYEIIFNRTIMGFDKKPYDLLKRVFESVGEE